MTMTDLLLQSGSKPYWKLFKLLRECYDKKVLTLEEASCFTEELDLLQSGNNRSHNTIPRSYWDKLSFIKEAKVLHNGPWNEDDWAEKTNGLD